MKKPFRVALSPARCSLDLGDGSERGEYVDQGHILTVLGRPHRSVGLMYCYYPYDRGWPRRVSEVYRNRGKFAWGYPYDDYFPYTGGPNGDLKGPVFRQMRDIRRHGQDVTLTLTMDCAVTDDHIRVLARDLRPFGRLRLRLNHECDGHWFAFNRRYSYEEVGRFFLRFATLMKREAPQVRMVCCWGHVEDPRTGRLKHEREFTPLLYSSDVWSTDKYLSLHWGWPYHACEPKDLDKSYFNAADGKVWRNLALIHKRFTELAGFDRGIEIGEFNADGNVGGEALQAKRTAGFYRRILREKPSFLKAVTLYQFRDRGRLGLEHEDPHHPGNGTPTPLLPVYREILREPYFLPRETWTPFRGSLRMEWRGSDDSDGLGWRIPLKGKPLFLELAFEKDANLMVKAGERWFYKKPGVEVVDVTPASVEWGKGRPFPIVVFAPPADGTNPAGATSVPTRLNRPPRMRLLYRWPARFSK